MSGSRADQAGPNGKVSELNDCVLARWAQKVAGLVPCMLAASTVNACKSSVSSVQCCVCQRARDYSMQA